MNEIARNIENILGEAVEISSPTERQAFLEKACAGDAKLRARVERLVACHHRAGSFLEHPVAIVEPGLFPADLELITSPGRQIGPYKILEQIGEGGMGLVYMAEQQQPLRRLVALKVIKPGMDTRQVVGRFEAERQALAMMDHPNIARIFDAGTTQSNSAELITAGRPYFVMELVRGTPITTFCDQKRLNVRERLELFLQVCQAVHHAHQKGIIHRDLKPTNVLVTMHDVAAVPKVIDFGVAKALGERLTERTLHTGIAQLIGTPLYMSPEQAELNELGVDTRSDIYSLGVLLYELLTGTTPFDKATLNQAGFDEMRRIIREDDPPRPSQRLSTLSARTTSTVADQNRFNDRRMIQHLRGELDWIVMKSLEKDRNRRYESASALAADIQRFLTDEPISARPTSVWYRGRKWLRRHPTSAIVMVISSLTVLTLSLGGWYYNHRLSAAFRDSQRFKADSLDQKRQLRLETYANDMRDAWIAYKAGNKAKALEDLKRNRPPTGEGDDLRGFEWYLLNAQCEPEIQTLRGHTAPILTADVSPDDRFIASGDSGGTIKIWDLNTGRELQTLQYNSQEITAVRFAPNGKSLASCGMDRTVRLWNVADWSEQACLRGHELTVCSLAWSPDSMQLASGGRDHKIKIWDAVGHREVQSLPDQVDVVRCVAWSPDGHSLAAAVRGDALHIWKTQTWQLWKSLSGEKRTGILALAYTPNSKGLASAGYGGDLLINDISQQIPSAEFDVAPGVLALSFSPDGTCLIAGRGDGKFQAWESRSAWGSLVTMQTIQVSKDVETDVRAVAFAHAGESVVIALEQDSVLQVRRSAELMGYRAFRISPACLDIAPNSNLAILRYPTGRPRLSSFPPREFYGKLVPVPRSIRDAIFFPQGDMLAILGDGPHVKVYDALTRQLRHILEAPGEAVRTITISQDGKSIAGSGETGTVWVWNLETQSIVHTLREHKKKTVRSAFSPDGKILATGSSNEQHILLWDVATGDNLGRLQVGQDVMALTFSPDGATLGIAGYEGAALLWDVPSRTRVAALYGHTGSLKGLAFSPDGRALATVGADGTARLWHVATRQELLTLTKRSIEMQWVKFLSPRQLVVGTSPYFPGPDGASDVLLFDAGKASSGPPQ